jgi:uncharacterized damage-inducible protein DinB
MQIQDLITLFDYTYWANHLIVSTSKKIGPEQFSSPTPFGWGSLHATLVHTLEAEHFWRILITEGRFAEEFTPADLPTLASIESRWREEEAAMRTYLSSLSDAGLARIVRYSPEPGVNRERVLWHCLFHMVNHGMQHRSECAAMLTSFGQSPGDLDFTLFLNQR